MKISKKGMTSKSFLLWASAAILILLIFYFKGSFHASPNQKMLPLAAILAIVCFFLSGRMIFKDLKMKISERFKKFLIWSGTCSTGVLICIVVYNLI